MRWPRGAQRRDALVALLLIAVGAKALAMAADFPARAAGWPTAIWSLLILFSLILLIGSFRGGDREDPS
jgi:hypothetical protein